MPQAMFCTLQTRYHPPQTELDLKAVARGLKQDGAAVSVSPSPVPTQTALPWSHPERHCQAPVDSFKPFRAHANDSFISREGSIDPVLSKSLVPLDRGASSLGLSACRTRGTEIQGTD